MTAPEAARKAAEILLSEDEWHEGTVVGVAGEIEPFIDAAIAAARQPLMDALTLIANAEPYDSAVSPRLVAQATLAKVKERKQ